MGVLASPNLKLRSFCQKIFEVLGISCFKQSLAHYFLVKSIYMVLLQKFQLCLAISVFLCLWIFIFFPYFKKKCYSINKGCMNLLRWQGLSTRFYIKVIDNIMQNTVVGKKMLKVLRTFPISSKMRGYNIWKNRLKINPKMQHISLHNLKMHSLSTAGKQYLTNNGT